MSKQTSALFILLNYKKFIILSSVTAAILIAASCFQKKAKSDTGAVSNLIIAQVDSFSAINNGFLNAVKENKSERYLQAQFLLSRLAYKKAEWAIEYFCPIQAVELNGAPVPEIEPNEIPGQPPLVKGPKGLQMIEPLLFPNYDTTQKAELIKEISDMQKACDKIKNKLHSVPILDWQVFDAARLDAFRIITLGITGFDAPVSLNSISETSASLNGIKASFCKYDSVNCSAILDKIDAAIAYLGKNKNDFNSFDRATFITDYVNPVSAEIRKTETALHIQEVQYNRLLRQTAYTLFDSGAFNVNEYVASFNDTATADKIMLGQQLFADVILSGNKTRSCQSCHQPDKGYTDGFVKNVALDDKTSLPRNTLTLLNAALQPAMFYDSRSGTLENQIKTVVTNRQEMNGSLEQAAALLWKDENYKKLFTKAFPVKNRNGIAPHEIQNALACYLRSLVKLNARFDVFMCGDKTAMTAEEIKGLNLFMGKAKCATCHYIPLFNGTVPPKFTKIESEIIGVPASNTAHPVIDADMGRYNIVKDNFYKHAFKTPTLRNISKTAPYMHNGVFSTLEQVMDFYNKGGGHGLGIPVENQTLPFDKLNLSDQEIAAVIAFLKTLDSR